MMLDACPSIAPFFGYMGVAFSIILANSGAAYGTAKSGVGILVAGISCPEQIWRNLIPIIMAGVNGIYGLITSIILMGAISAPENGQPTYSLFTGFAHLAAGLCCGLCGLASGMAIGLSGSSSVQACGYFEYQSKKKPAKVAQTGGKKKKKEDAGGDKLFVVMVLIQVFAGNLALYGLITSIILSQSTYYCDDV